MSKLKTDAPIPKTARTRPFGWCIRAFNRRSATVPRIVPAIPNTKIAPNSIKLNKPSTKDAIANGSRLLSHSPYAAARTSSWGLGRPNAIAPL